MECAYERDRAARVAEIRKSVFAKELAEAAANLKGLTETAVVKSAPKKKNPQLPDRDHLPRAAKQRQAAPEPVVALASNPRSRFVEDIGDMASKATEPWAAFLARSHTVLSKPDAQPFLREASARAPLESTTRRSVLYLVH